MSEAPAATTAAGTSPASAPARPADQPCRLAAGGRIDRSRTLRFTFNGKDYRGYRGDTLASALLANDVRLIGRSFKYHRPRGIVAAGAEEPNAIVQLGRGARALPNQRATQIELYPNLYAASVNVWPSPERDLRAVNGAIAPLLPAGFYYKTFMWPATAWKTYERHIRQAAGLGRAPERADPDRYDKRNAHCDVLVVGAGPAGLAAALTAAASGARVVLADEQPEPGGSLLGSGALLDGRPAADWVAYALDQLRARDNVTLLTRTTAFGYYDHNFIALLERRSDHLPPNSVDGPRQRLWRLRAKRVVLSTGAFERPLVFANNDRPGVMLASAVSTYIHRYGVCPGRRAVVFTNNDSAYRTALDLDLIGVPVSVVDARPHPNGALARWARERGIPIRAGRAVADVQGVRRVEGARLLTAKEQHGRDGETPDGVGCDLIAVSGGWNPAVHLHAQSGGRPRWDDERHCFVPGEPVQPQTSAGACNGTFTLAGCLREGAARGAAAAAALGFDVGPPELPVAVDFDAEPLRPLWLVSGLCAPGRGPKQFVDLQNDTSAADILLAAREGFRSIEHVKRYTALGFGTDQGKLGNVNGMAILARALGQEPGEVGTTTYRPAYTPVDFGALAGRDIGPLLDPLRKTPLDGWHAAHGAAFENVGQWRRAWYYPLPGEDQHAAVARECRAVRNDVGIFDGSTLGKIDIQGPDAVTLLNRVYTNRWDQLAIGRCRYGLMLGEDGMVMDDGVTARLGEQHFLMTTTTGNAAAVLDWLERWLQTEWPDMQVYLTSVTDHWATIALAGPDSRALLGEVSDEVDLAASAFPFMAWRDGRVAGVAARIMRISFSGELAYEINVPADAARHVWETLYERGRAYGITPYGTETMHVLRAEKGYIIVGQETDGSVTPVDLGLGGMLSNSKDFLGKRSLARSYCAGTGRKQLVGLRCISPAQQVLAEGAAVIGGDGERLYERPLRADGHVTSSYYSATLGHPIALALVRDGRSRIGERVFVSAAAADSTVAAEIVAPLFYDPQGERLHG